MTDLAGPELMLLLADRDYLSREELVTRARLLDQEADRLQRRHAAAREQADREWSDLGGRP